MLLLDRNFHEILKQPNLNIHRYYHHNITYNIKYLTFLKYNAFPINYVFIDKVKNGLF